VSSDEAKRIYDAFRAVRPVDADGIALPELEQLADGGAGWFAVVNHRDQVAEPPRNMHEPYDVEIREIEPRRDDEGDIIIEELPTKITIRPRVADDQCVPEYGGDASENAVFARTLGLPLDIVEWRMWPEDTEAGKILVADAAGTEGAEVCERLYREGGGTQKISTLPFYAGWRAVAREVLTTYHDAYALVRCRTPEVGTLKVGPLRSGHLRIYQSRALASTEWDGRLEALAKATGRDCRRLSLEDARHLWDAFDTLKKKVETRRNSIVASMWSATSSTDDPTTSTT
jgi:hypothetical protein